MIIAIDGLAGSGKSSTAKKLAEKLGFNYFSTGKMYRAITCYAINNSLIKGLPHSLKNHIKSLKIELLGKNFNKIILNDKNYNTEIYSTKVNKYVSSVSSISYVRNKMVKIQREVSKNNNIVCEGRDIGTVVFPDADFKFFFKADLKSRVERRYLDMKNLDSLITKKKLKEMIRARDLKDINRKISPLKRAKDAVLLITTNMKLEEQIDFIYKKVKQ